MKILKNYAMPLVLGIAFGLILLNFDYIRNKLADVLENEAQIVIRDDNEYTKNYDFKYVQVSKDFRPYSYQDILNIFFTIINNGWDTFTFYCPSEYEDCLDDLVSVSNDDVLLTNINNFTHPFNNFRSISTAYYENGEVTINVEKIYKVEEINEINKSIERILKEVIKDDMVIEEKLEAIHDYVINHAKYDQQKNNTGESPYKSNSAYGILIQGYGLCSGYADTMAIFLEKLNIKNFKVASIIYEETGHVWNAAYINNEWYHIDLTWDDPVSDDGKDNLWHKYFLIKSDKFVELDKADERDHIFDKSVYLEFRD